MLLNTILPILGIVIIAFTIGAYIFKYGLEYRQANQRFKGLGLEIEISVITIYLMLGVVFCGTGIFFSEWNDVKKVQQNELKLDTLQKEVYGLKENVNSVIQYFKSNDITYTFTLDSSYYKSNFPDTSYLVCTYFDNWKTTQGTDYVVGVGPERGSYTVTIRHLIEREAKSNTSRIQVFDKKANKRWICNSFNPLRPAIKLDPHEN